MLPQPVELVLFICPFLPHCLLVLTGEGLRGWGATSFWQKHFLVYKDEKNECNSVWYCLNLIGVLLKTESWSYLFFLHTPVLQPLETQRFSGKEFFVAEWLTKWSAPEPQSASLAHPLKPESACKKKLWNIIISQKRKVPARKICEISRSLACMQCLWDCQINCWKLELCYSLYCSHKPRDGIVRKYE